MGLLYVSQIRNGNFARAIDNKIGLENSVFVNSGNEANANLYLPPQGIVLVGRQGGALYNVASQYFDFVNRAHRQGLKIAAILDRLVNTGMDQLPGQNEGIAWVITNPRIKPGGKTVTELAYEVATFFGLDMPVTLKARGQYDRPYPDCGFKGNSIKEGRSVWPPHGWNP